MILQCESREKIEKRVKNSFMLYHLYVYFDYIHANLTCFVLLLELFFLSHFNKIVLLWKGRFVITFSFKGHSLLLTNEWKKIANDLKKPFECQLSAYDEIKQFQRFLISFNLILAQYHFHLFRNHHSIVRIDLHSSFFSNNLAK